MINLHKYKNKNGIIVYFILGIPLFLEILLTISFSEGFSNSDISYSSAYIPVKLFQILTVLFTMYFSFTATNFKKTVILSWIFFIYIPTIINVACIYFTGTHITSDFMQAIFNTHLREVLLLVQQYFILLTINIVVLILPFCFKQKKISATKKKYEIAMLALFWISIFVSKTLPVNKIFDALLNYITDIRELEDYKQEHTPIQGIVCNKHLGKQTYVFVIGESVDRKHMSIYGYDKATTPYFSDLKRNNRLFVFENVNTAHVFTSAAVKSMIQIEDDHQSKHSVIQFFKDAGFKTFWFSNQGKVDAFDNSVMRRGKMCDEYAFIHDKNIIYSSEKYNFIYKNMKRRLMLLDEDLLRYFQTALQDPSEKKLIILHFKGSHPPMDMRYPPEFAKFRLPDKYYDRMKALAVCHYDNSILYVDYLLNEIISSLEKENCVSWLLYLSDHGQDIYDTKESVLTARIKPHAYEIPFVIWISDKYRQENSDFVDSWNMKVPYITDRTGYSIIDLARMKHPAIAIRNNSIFRKK